MTFIIFGLLAIVAGLIFLGKRFSQRRVISAGDAAQPSPSIMHVVSNILKGIIIGGSLGLILAPFAGMLLEPVLNNLWGHSWQESPLIMILFGLLGSFIGLLIAVPKGTRILLAVCFVGFVFVISMVLMAYY